MDNMIYLRKWGGLYQNMVNSRAQLLEGRLTLSKPRVFFSNIDPGDRSLLFKSIFSNNFLHFFRASDHQTVDNKNETELAFYAFIFEFKFRIKPELS